MSTDFQSIPLIDISPLVAKCDDPNVAEDKDVAQVVRHLDQACREAGFFYVKGHGIPDSLIKKVRDMTHKFFDLPYEEKIKIKLSDATGYRGYQQVGQNITKGIPDIHEAIDCYKELNKGLYGDFADPLVGSNKWPTEPSNFKELMEEYLVLCTDLSRKIMRGIALALGGPVDVFEGKIAGDPFWVLRIIGYPGASSISDDGLPKNDVGCGAHTDYGLLTLVNQDDDITALQVRNHSGEWISAVPIPRTFVCNIGDMLKILTNGLYESTLHRVINNSPKYRVCVAYFYETNFNAAISPLDMCMKKSGGNKKFGTAIYGEHLVLVLDEADRILDAGFKKEVNAIISQLPKHRQTLLFSATQTKSVKDLARLSLKDPEYVAVDEEAIAATPTRLQQKVILVPLDQKLDMLWSFIKAHLNSRILVFLSTCKQVRFVYEAFKKLRPGIPLKCLHGRMKQIKRTFILQQFVEQQSFLFSTDVSSRGLDFNKGVDWVVQVDCPDDVAGYIHRVGRTARYDSAGRSVLFLLPSEMKMLERLQEKKIPIQFDKPNTKRLQSVSGLLAALLAKYTVLQPLAERAFKTYVKSIYKQKDKEVFDVTKLPIDDYSASFGLPMTPQLRYLNRKNLEKKGPTESSLVPEMPVKKDLIRQKSCNNLLEESEDDETLELLHRKETADGEGNAIAVDNLPITRVLKKKKLKINVHRPVGTRVVFDEEGNTLPPLATLADTRVDSALLDKDKVLKRFADLKEEMKSRDKEDKQLDRQRRKEKRIKEKIKYKRARDEEDEDEENDDFSGSDKDSKNVKRNKVYFDSDSDNESKDKMALKTDAISLAEQEELALKLLSSMHS